MRVSLSMAQGTSFEVQVIQLLSTRFPEAEFLHNIQVFSCDLQKETQVDVLMIHPRGMIAIEAKDWKKFIKGSYSDRKWTGQGRGKSTMDVFNPVYQNWIHCRALWASALGSGLLLPFIHNMVCVPNETYIDSECTELCNLSYLEHKVRQVVETKEFFINVGRTVSLLRQAKCWKL